MRVNISWAAYEALNSMREGLAERGLSNPQLVQLALQYAAANVDDLAEYLQGIEQE